MRMLIATLATLFLAAAVSAQPVEVRLEVIPAHTLPGIPVSVRVTFTASASKTAPLPPAAVLMATPEAGERFPALWGWQPIAPFEGDETEVGKAPVVREFAADGSLGRPAWFFNRQFTRPGTYQLQLYAGDFRNADQPYPEIIQQATAVSNTVLLTVAEPKGADAAVWKALLEHAREPYGWLAEDVRFRGGPELVQRLLREYPDSQYAGWLVTMGTAGTREDRTEASEALRAWLEKHPDDPYFEWRMLRVADWEVFSTLKHLFANRGKSKLHETKAREALGKLENAHQKEVRERAKDRLEYLQDLGQ